MPHPHLEQELDWNDLIEMLDREKLCSLHSLGLTAVEIHAIEANHPNNSKLQR